MSDPKSKKARKFQTTWEENFGFIENGDRVVCTICNEPVTARTYNVERHYMSKHNSSLSKMSSEEKVEFIKKCVKGYSMQRGGLQKFVKQHQLSTRASFVACLGIMKHGKPFTDGEFLKEMFIDCSEEMFCDFQNKKEILNRIKEMPLSARTVQRRIDDMSKSV